MFIGDSHMAQYYLRAQRLSEREHVNFGMIAKAGWFLFNDQRMGDYARAVKAIVADKRVHTLVIGSMWGGKIKEEEFYEVAATVRPLLETRKDLKVYVMLDYPWTPNVGGQQGIYDPLKHVNRITGEAVAWCSHSLQPMTGSAAMKKSKGFLVTQLNILTPPLLSAQIKNAICRLGIGMTIICSPNASKPTASG